MKRRSSRTGTSSEGNPWGLEELRDLVLCGERRPITSADLVAFATR
ncbi:hypothetical protein [Streptomyces sanglieri]